jgi:hypothetical protein
MNLNGYPYFYCSFAPKLSLADHQLLVLILPAIILFVELYPKPQLINLLNFINDEYLCVQFEF